MKIFKFLPIILLPLGLVITSTTGYMIIEKWSFCDSLYMTIITVATVGYGEIHPLTPAGRIFTMIIILFGVALFAYISSKFVFEIANIDRDKGRRKKMKNKINKLNGHSVICGYGRMGEVTCKELSKYDLPFVVIEKKPNLIEALKKSELLYIEGDAGDDDVLLAAGVDRAKVLISVIDDDTEGLYLAIVGRSLNKNLYIIVRADDIRAKKRILRAGADKVIRPYAMTGKRVADSVINPAVEDLFDLTDDDGNDDSNKVKLADLYVPSHSIIIDRKIREIGDQMRGLIIVGVRNEDQAFNFNPSADYIFKDKDFIITLGTQKAYDQAKKDFKLLTKR